MIKQANFCLPSSNELNMLHITLTTMIGTSSASNRFNWRMKLHDPTVHRVLPLPWDMHVIPSQMEILLLRRGIFFCFCRLSHSQGPWDAQEEGAPGFNSPPRGKEQMVKQRGEAKHKARHGGKRQNMARLLLHTLPPGDASKESSSLAQTSKTPFPSMAT